MQGLEYADCISCRDLIPHENEGLMYDTELYLMTRLKF